MPTLLHRRGTRYHRSIVPKCQRHLFHGKVQFWRSPGTLDRDFSAVRSAPLEYETRRLFYTLEHSTMDKAEIVALIRQWQDKRLCRSHLPRWKPQHSLTLTRRSCAVANACHAA
jgi:hypothetical protein